MLDKLRAWYKRHRILALSAGNSIALFLLLSLLVSWGVSRAPTAQASARESAPSQTEIEEPAVERRAESRLEGEDRPRQRTARRRRAGVTNQ